eukprot:scaffold7738_cov133-Cylindrotheca_fusiformis.AAC.18
MMRLILDAPSIVTTMRIHNVLKSEVPRARLKWNSCKLFGASWTALPNDGLKHLSSESVRSLVI